MTHVLVCLVSYIPISNVFFPLNGPPSFWHQLIFCNCSNTSHSLSIWLFHSETSLPFFSSCSSPDWFFPRPGADLLSWTFSLLLFCSQHLVSSFFLLDSLLWRGLLRNVNGGMFFFFLSWDEWKYLYNSLIFDWWIGRVENSRWRLFSVRTFMVVYY